MAMTNTELFDDIKSIMQKAQESTAIHQVCISNLQVIYKSCDLNEFMGYMQRILEVTVQVGVKPYNEYHERLMEFISSFFTTFVQQDKPEDNENCEQPAFIEAFKFLFKTLELNSEIVRYRSCQLMGKMLDKVVGFDIDEDLCEEIIDATLNTLQDPKSSVRIESVRVLYHLQDPTDVSDEIVKSFIHSMNTDNSAEVRALIVQKIVPQKCVIEHIVKRTKDVCANVRFAAYARLSKLARFLKIKQRHRVVLNGFSDNSPKIQEYIAQEFPIEWLHQYDDDYLQLTKAMHLDFDESVEVNKHILMSLFKTQPLEEIIKVLPLDNRLIQFEHLNFETIVYWRFLIEHFRQDAKYENVLDEILPELVHFCRYIEEYWSYVCKQDLKPPAFSEHNFILKQMFVIMQGYDFGDVASCKCLNNLVGEFLQNHELESDVIGAIIKNLEFCIPEVNARSNFVCKLISEIMCPLEVDEEYEKSIQERDSKVAQLKMELCSLKNNLDTAVKEGRYLDAGKLNEKIEELEKSLTELTTTTLKETETVKKTDLPTIEKCLDVAIKLLSSPQITRCSPELESLKKNFLEEVLIHLQNPAISAKILKCYVLFCVIDKKSALTGIQICSAPIVGYKNCNECDVPTLIVAICGVVDMLLLWGSHIIARPENDGLPNNSMSEEHHSIFYGGTSLTVLVRGLIELMQDETPQVQECAGEGLCKLISHGCVYSALIISHLIIKWSSPTTTDSLRQCIGYALQNLPQLPKTVENLEKAIIPTLKTLLNAPPGSPLVEVDVYNIGKFMLTLCSCYKEGVQIHSNLALKFLQEIKNEKNHALIYSKMLLLLEVNKDKFFLNDLANLCDEIKEENIGRSVSNNLNKFSANLKMCLKNFGEQDESREDAQCNN